MGSAGRGPGQRPLTARAGRAGWVIVGAVALLAVATVLVAVVWGRDDPGSRGSGPGAATGADPDAPRPNIVLITSDDQRADDMLAMPQTVRRLGSAGTTFERAYATFPLCCPARASILTGQYAHNHGVLGNGTNGVGGYQAFDNSSTVVTWLHDAGYRTSFVGKYLNRYGSVQPLAVPDGWDEFRASVAGGNYFDTRLYDGSDTSETDQYQTDLYADLAVDALTEGLAGDEPFFLWTSFYAPHSGLPAEDDDPGNGVQTPAVDERYRDAFADLGLPDTPNVDEADVSDKPTDVASRQRLSPQTRAGLIELRQQRLESLLSLDDAVGRLLDTLEASGELADTLVVFTSDNGYMLGEHRIQAGKTVPYEPAALVPLLVSGPGFPAGQTRPQPVALIDLAPTFVELAGATAGLPIDGVSLTGPAADPDVGRDRSLLLESGPENVGDPLPYTGARSGRYVYVEYLDGQRELYDLQADPYQLRNLARDPTPASQVIIDDYAARAAALADCAGDDCRLD